MKTALDHLTEARTANGKTFNEVEKKRSRGMALALTAATLASLVFMAFALVQKSVADRSEQKAAELEKQLLECRGSK